MIREPLPACRSCRCAGFACFPGMVTHFDVGRKKSVLAVEEALRENQRIFLVAQKDVQTDDPKMRDLYDIGTIAEIKQILRMPGENMRILVEGCVRAELIDVVQSEPYLFGRVSELADVPVTRSSTRTDALVRYAHSQFEQFCELVGRNIQEPLLQMLTADDLASCGHHRSACDLFLSGQAEAAGAAASRAAAGTCHDADGEGA